MLHPLSNYYSYTRYFTSNDQQYRDLVKAYGILFMVEATGQVSETNQKFLKAGGSVDCRFCVE